MYNLTAKAFNLADRYRVPVFLMADEVIGHMRERIIVPDTVEHSGPSPTSPGLLHSGRLQASFPGFLDWGKGSGRM